jgi:hypothetical protein
MPRNAKINISLALLSILFLVINPAGFCAGSPMAKSPSHPCCPSGPAPQQHDLAKTSCVCIDRQPTAPSLPANDAGGSVVAVSPDSSPQLAAGVVSAAQRVAERVIFPPNDRYLQFHQLLV